MPEGLGASTNVTIFRCDGGVDGGLGHVSRSLALAEALDPNAPSLFVGEYSAHARALLCAARIEHREPGGNIGSAGDLAALLSLADERAALGFVIDSYAATTAYLSALAQRAPLAVLDDFAALDAYPCAAVVNMTLSGPTLVYPPGEATMLLGPEYLLARRAVRELGRKRIPASIGRRALVALGGVDRHGLTARVLRTLAEIDASLEVRVVVRPGDQALSAIQAELESFRSAEVHSGLDTLAPLYDWADLCVSGGGLMKYEAALLGLPTGVLPQTDGEARDAARCGARGFVLDLGAPDDPLRPRRAPLERLVHNVDMRRQLYDASAGLFVADPTVRAAREVLAALRSAHAVRCGAT